MNKIKDKILFNTPIIEIPKNMIITTKKGLKKLKKTLTDKNNLTSYNKKKAIILQNTNKDEINIINKGEKIKVNVKVKKNINKKLLNFKPETLDFTPIKEVKKEKIKEINNIKKENIIKVQPKKALVANISKIEEKKDNNNIINIYKEIDDYNKILSTSRQDTLKKINNLNEKIKILSSVQDLGNFYNTPDKYAEYIYEDTKKEQYKNILDIGAGLLGLTKYIIKNTINDELYFINKIYLNEINKDFINIIKPLEQDKRIEIFDKDILLNYNHYFNKNLQLIISNPPYTAWVDNKENKLGYLFFLYVIYRIAQKNIKSSIKPIIYVIIPKTYYNNNDNGYFDIPKKTKEDIIKYFKNTDKKLNINYDYYDEDLNNNWFYGVKFISDVKGFKKYSKGTITDMGLTVGLFECYL